MLPVMAGGTCHISRIDPDLTHRYLRDKVGMTRVSWPKLYAQARPGAESTREYAIAAPADVLDSARPAEDSPNLGPVRLPDESCAATIQPVPHRWHGLLTHGSNHSTRDNAWNVLAHAPRPRAGTTRFWLFASASTARDEKPFPDRPSPAATSSPASAAHIAVGLRCEHTRLSAVGRGGTRRNSAPSPCDPWHAPAGDVSAALLILRTAGRRLAEIEACR